MKFRIVSILAFALACSAQTAFPPGAAGAGTGVSNIHVSVAGPATTSGSIDITAMQLTTQPLLNTLGVWCFTGTGIASSEVTGNLTSLACTLVRDSNTAVHVTFTSSSNVLVILNSNGGAGSQGSPGSSGPAGNSVLNGSGAPSSGTGANGDFYLRTDTTCLYGPKSAGSWPGSCVSLVGPGGGGTLAIQQNGNPIGARGIQNILDGTCMASILSDTGTAITFQPNLDTTCAPTKANIQAGVSVLCVSASSSGTTYTCALDPTLTAYTSGMVLQWKPDVNGAAGAVTLNVDGLGAKSVKESDGTTNPTSTDIIAGHLYSIWYDGTVIRILNSGVSVSKAQWQRNYFFSNGTGGGAFAGVGFACSITSGCTPAQATSGSDPGIITADFPNSADKSGYVSDVLPSGWDGGTVTLYIWESPGATGISGNVTFTAQTRCLADGGNPFTTSGFNAANTNTKSITVGGTAGLFVHSMTLTMTGCSPGNFIQILIARVGTTDSLATPARVNQISLEMFTTLL